MSAYKNIAILGASGNVGKPILKALLDAGQFEVTVLSRKESNATFPTAAKVVKTDFSADSLADLFRGQDVVISAVTTQAVDEQIKFIDAALKAGVKRFITSDFGSDVENPKNVEAIPFTQAKVDVVDYLRKKESQGLSWSAVVTGAFTEMGLTTGLLGFQLKERKARIYDSGDYKTTTTTYANIGQSVVGILSKPDETANRYVHIASFVVSQNELLAVIEKVVGEKFTVERSTTEELKAGEPGVMEVLAYGTFSEGKAGDYALRKNDSKLLGLEKEDLETVIRGVCEGLE